jgi:hypothetical protein
VNASIQNEDHECRHARCLLSNWLEHLPNEVRERVRLESLSNPQPSEFSHERQTYANLLCIYIQSVLIPLGASRWCQDCLDQHGFALTVDQLAELNKAITLLAAEERTITPDNSRSDSPFTSAAADAVNHGEENLSAVQSTLGRVKSAYRRSREALNELWQKPKPALSLVKSFLSGDRRRTALLTAGSLVFFMIALIYNARRQRWRQLPQRSAVFSRQSIDV